MKSKTPTDRHPKTTCCGYEARLDLPHPVMWNEFNKVVQCHNCGQVYDPKVIPEPFGLAEMVWRWLLGPELTAAIYQNGFLKQKVASLQNDVRVANECYSSNLDECVRLEWRIRDLRFRLSEIGRAERKYKPRLP
jgi:hypothetical protein